MNQWIDMINGLTTVSDSKLAFLVCAFALVVVFKALHVIERLRARRDD